MTGGQSTLALDEARTDYGAAAHIAASAISVRPPEPLRVIRASAEECAAHAELTRLLQKASGGKCIWLAAT
jgi:DNA polymerase-3 subunit epsilon